MSRREHRGPIPRGALRAGRLLACAVPLIGAAGCGGAAQKSTAPSSTTTSSAIASHASTSAVAPPAAPHIAILSPRPGASTASTLTVRVAVRGLGSARAPRLNYVLDRVLLRRGSARLTFHDLAPGHHRLDVSVAATGAARASRSFTVRPLAPAPRAVPAEAPAPAAAPAPMAPSAGSPSQGEGGEPRRSTGTPPSAGIPQGGGGDGDGDNSGGPSDGDGNI